MKSSIVNVQKLPPVITLAHGTFKPYIRDVDDVPVDLDVKVHCGMEGGNINKYSGTLFSLTNQKAIGLFKERILKDDTVFLFVTLDGLPLKIPSRYLGRDKVQEKGNGYVYSFQFLKPSANFKKLLISFIRDNFKARSRNDT
jgi:hypothetical protein